MELEKERMHSGTGGSGAFEELMSFVFLKNIFY